MIEWVDFCGGNYELNTPNAANARTINWIPEVIERGPRAGKLRLLQVPGLKFFKQVGTGPIRAVWSAGGGQLGADDQLFVISGAQLWRVYRDGTPSVLRGHVGNDAHPAYITANGFQLAIASAGAAYMDPGGPNPVFPLVDTLGNPINAQSIAFQDQYFIVAIRDTKQLLVSNLAPDGATWDPGNVALKEGYADNISRIWVDQPGGEYLWIFGDETTEIWENTAGPFPFSRVQSMVFPIGCESPWSVAGVLGARFWYWRGRVWEATGMQPERISDFGIETAIAGYSLYDRKNCEGWSWAEGGHVFYALSFPEANRTWVYDRSTRVWHQRLQWRPGLGPGVYWRYVPRMGSYAWGTMIVGDYRNNTLWEMDRNTYTDADGGLLRRERQAPFLTNDMNNTRVSRLTLDVDTGVGLNVPEGTLGYDPRVILQYSIDRGKTWSRDLPQSLGKIGETERRVFWGQLNAARIGLAANIIVTDPVPANIEGMFIDFSPGTYPRQGVS